jgi:ABC-2 type transport system ATP-binding protein
VTAAIETSGITKVFRPLFRRGEIRAVEDISLRVEPGTTFGLLGPNGAGKTTFVKMLLAVVRPTSGSARILGRDVREAESRRPIGYLPENHRFPAYMTGASMLDFFGALSGMDRRDRKKRIPELLAAVKLEAWGGVRLRKYSKGMLQRLGLAQAMLHSPSLLVLDEPTDGVDPIGRREIRDILQRLEERGVTVFINSHLLAEVELLCRDVAILHRGRLALTGKVKDLTEGGGYRVSAVNVPELLVEELRRKASACAARDGLFEFQYATREAANEAVDALRAERCDIDAIARTVSTLEEVFVRTVSA